MRHSVNQSSIQTFRQAFRSVTHSTIGLHKFEPSTPSAAEHFVNESRLEKKKKKQCAIPIAKANFPHW